MENRPECPYCGYPLFGEYINGRKAWLCICDESKEKKGTLRQVEARESDKRQGLTWSKTDLVETRGIR